MNSSITRKRLNVLLALLLSLAILLYAIPAVAASVKVIYASKYGSGNGSGTSWQDSMTLEAALGYEPQPGEKVKVFLKGGDYNITKPLEIKEGVYLYGSFSGNEVYEGGRIKVDRDKNGIIEPWEFISPTVLKVSGVVVKIAGGVVSGVTIESTSDGSGSIAELESGGVLENSIVTGGAINLDNGSLLSCYIHGNKAPESDGTINVAGPAIISHSRIENNEAINGAGVYIDTSSDVYITNNLIAYNNAAISGGAIYIAGAANARIINNTIVYNGISEEKGKAGAGVHITVDDNINLAFYNNVIWGNDGGDQVYRESKSEEVLGTYAFYNNAIGEQSQDFILFDDTYNNIDISKSNHKDLFKNSGSFEPKSSSVLVDKGNNDGYTSNARSFSTAHNVLLGYDLKNSTRVSGTIDIGAYEFIEKPDMPAPSLSWAPAGGGGGGGTPNKPEPPKCTCDGCTGDGCECNGNCPECKCPGCEQSVEEPTCPCEECDDCDCPDCGCGEGGDEQPNCPCDVCDECDGDCPECGCGDGGGSNCPCDGCSECDGDCTDCDCGNGGSSNCPCSECGDCGGDCTDCDCGNDEQKCGCGNDCTCGENCDCSEDNCSCPNPDMPNCPCDKHCFGILFCKCLILGCKKCWLTKWMRFILGLFF